MTFDYSYVQPLVESDGSPTFQEAYPVRLPFFYNGVYSVELPSSNPFYRVDRRYTLEIVQTLDGFTIPSWLTDLGVTSSTVYAFTLHSAGDFVASPEWYASHEKYCYYMFTESYDMNGGLSGGRGVYLRMQSSDLELVVPPSGSPVQGEDVYFLYSLGQNLVSFANQVYSILVTPIGNTTLINLLLGSGFTLYISWVIFKWVIPF